MKKETLFVDFDHVLFNTQDFRKELSGLVLPPNIKRFVYDDTPAFLEYAEKYCTLILLTEGEQAFQREKVKESRILEMASFEETIIVPVESKTKRIGLLKDVYSGRLLLVDDKPDNVDAAIRAGVTVIRVRRGKYSDQESEMKPDYEVGSLQEIIDQKILEKWLEENGN